MVSIAPTMSQGIQTKVFADGADLASIVKAATDPLIGGFTTNPTLMNKAGITDYQAFASTLLEAVPNHPISFEVFADDVDEIKRQALLIATWGDNVYVKIPVTNTEGLSLAPLVQELSESGVKVNVTALFTTAQVQTITDAVKNGAPSNISVFAGRIADAGIDPLPIMAESVEIAKAAKDAEIIWASPREVYNYVQAQSIGCHIITMTNDLIAKIPSIGKDLDQFSLETVQMFRRDAVSAGFEL
jgi:transaldolase